MPKSSMATRTPISRRACSLARAPGRSLMRTFSVISSTSRRGDSPLSSRTCLIVASSCSSPNWRGERLTETMPRSASGTVQARAVVQARRRTWSPRATMSPDVSAAPMKAPGRVPARRERPPRALSRRPRRFRIAGPRSEAGRASRPAPRAHPRRRRAHRAGRPPVGRPARVRAVPAAKLPPDAPRYGARSAHCAVGPPVPTGAGPSPLRSSSGRHGRVA